MFSGVATWTDQQLWGSALSANWPDITLPLIHTDLNYMYDSGTIPFIHAMTKPETTQNRQIVQDIRRGDYDPQIDAWLIDLKTYTDTGRKCVIVPFPESNGTWVNYGVDRNHRDPQAAVDIYKRFVEMGRAAGLTPDKVLWCWAPNDVGWGRLSQYWPGDQWVDIVGGSVYNWGGLGKGEPWLTPVQVIDPYVRDIRRLTDKPIIVTQTGAGEGDSRTPGWLDQLVDYTRGGKIDGFIWFSISEFTYAPGPTDFAARVVSIGVTRPDRWFIQPAVDEMFPDAIWVGSKRVGKPWSGTTAPKVVLHTLEFEGWPNPQKWDEPSHLVANPNTGEIRQYLPMDVAAYSVRNNDLEDDYPMWQVELWGRAADVPGYGDDWYRGVAGLVDVFNTVYDVPLIFADFSTMDAGPAASQRMTDSAVRSFSGFLGHGHVGRGVDAHWDPGKLNVAKVVGFIADIAKEGEEMRLPDLKLYDGYSSKGRGEFSDAVAAMQILLARKGFVDLRSRDRRCAADGKFGPGTLAALKLFQQSVGLVVDGVCGLSSWKALFSVTP